MKTKQYIIVGLVFAMIVALGLAGGSWTTTSAKGTVPKTPPGLTHQPPLPTRHPRHVPPGSGETCTSKELENVGDVSICFLNGTPELDYQVSIDLTATFPASEKIQPFTPVFKISLVKDGETLPGNKFSQAATLYVELDPAPLGQFTKDNKASLFWYNPQSHSWQKIPSSLVDGELSAQVKSAGLFVLATSK